MARLLRMPEVAANAINAVLSEWPVGENVPFAANDAIATIETEKAVVDVPAEESGVILRQLVPAGSEVAVGTPIALLGDSGETGHDVEKLLAALGIAPQGAVTALTAAIHVASTGAVSTGAVSTDARVLATQPEAGSGQRIFSSPLARRLARERGYALEQLVGTGPGGRIVRRDIERATTHGGSEVADGHVQGPLGAPTQASSAYDDIPHTRMRRAIASRLTDSVREAPHFFVSGTARVDKLLKLRARLNATGSTKVTLNDLVVAAAARAHVAVPEMNVTWLPDAVRRYHGVDISVAVATERGLVTPVVRGVELLSVTALAATTADLVARARSGRLRDAELTGGSLTVTNMGALGVESFSAIINPPQSAILAVGAARQEPIVVKGGLRVGTVLHVTLSVDHRPVDGVVAARWMAVLLEFLSEPVRILA